VLCCGTPTEQSITDSGAAAGMALSAVLWHTN